MRTRWAGWVALTTFSWLHGCDPDPLPPDPPDVVEDAFHDPLSMPEEATLSADSFTAAAECATCHPTHYEEWSTSSHAYAMVDPVFRGLVAVRQADFGGTQDQFCVQCHSAVATRGGEIVDNFSFDDLSPIALEGVTCEACHKVAETVRPFNSGHVLAPDGPQRGTIADPDTGPLGHEAAHDPAFASSLFCAGCHDVIEVNGIELERPFGEWLESPAKGDGTTCQTCHMKPRKDTPAGLGGPDRVTHDHRFVGVDVPMAPGFLTEAQRDEVTSDVAELLAEAASLHVSAAPSVTAGTQLDVLVTVKNEISGHNLPTGTTFVRELWVELTARDGLGNVLFQTGDLDQNGDLRHHFSELEPYGDHDLLTFGGVLLDAGGTPTIFPWRAVELRSNAIPPKHERTFTLFVPTAADTPGPIQIDARLRFRTHGPHMLRTLGLDDLVERIPTFDIATTSTSCSVTLP